MSFQPCQGISQGATARRPRSWEAEASSAEVSRFAADRSVFRSFKYRTLGMRQLWLDPFSVQFDNASIVPHWDYIEAQAPPTATTALEGGGTLQEARGFSLPAATGGVLALGWERTCRSLLRAARR